MRGSCELFVISLALLYRTGLCEVYTSAAEMTQVIQLEVKLIESLEKHIQAERRKLDSLVRYTETFKEENNKALKNIELYLENPISAFLLVKRLTRDLEQIESLISSNSSKDIRTDIRSYRENPSFPTDADLNGTVRALTRLQDIYGLDSDPIARGILNGVKYSSELGASDCFLIGKNSFENKNFYYSHLWLNEAYKRVNLKTDDFVETGVILEYMALSAYRLGHVYLALNITNRLLELFRDYPEALKTKVEYEKEIRNGNRTDIIEPVSNKSSMKLYQQLCRKTVSPPIEVVSRLKCRYKNNNPFSRIAPFKVEELSLQPKVLLFYNVISDEEISVLKELSYPRLERARVVNNTGKEVFVSSERIGKVAWFSSRDHEYVAKVNKRVKHMTGLSIKTGEPLQVSNYGVGGHFLTHLDYSTDLNANGLPDGENGNRIATILFYMSNVIQGGETVFPSLKLTVPPIKGSAAFWYNLHPNGTGDRATVHGSCPVIVGSKWISNKWLNEYGQEFLRPCGIDRFFLDSI